MLDTASADTTNDVLTDEEKKQVEETVNEVLESSSKEREDLIPVLQKVQNRLGYLPSIAMELIASAMNIYTVDIYSIATFYNQFRLNPPGKNQIKVCMGTACYMIGAQNTLDSFERRLEIKEGETTSDREFSLERVACVGCCTMAPVVVVNEKVEGSVTPTRVDGIMLSFDTYNGNKEKEEKGESA